MQDIAVIITGLVQLVFTGGIFLWLIKKISGFGERLAALESVFDYMRSDHDRIVGIEKTQEKLKTDLNHAYDKIRSMEHSRH